MTVNSSLFHDVHYCRDTTARVSINSAFLVTKFFIFLPLSLFVLYLGHQRWRQQRSFTTTSHSDIFTYHSAAMELVYVLGAFLYFGGKHSGLSGTMTVGYYFCSVVLPGHTSLHILTCVERYLAVVHPVIYLSLRQSGGVRIRNISTGCVWLLCTGWIGFTALYSPDIPYIPFFCLLISSLVVMSFCSLSVLCVLIHPGPGETGGGKRDQVNKSKQRAFHTITTITGVLWFSFVGFLVCAALDTSHVLSSSVGCLVLMCGYWTALPSSLVLPVLFLQRAGKLCCHCSN